MKFFGTVESLYVFIEASTKHHTIFVSNQSSIRPICLKRLSDTRWACCIDSLKAIDTTLPSIISTLEEIEGTENNGHVACEAKALLDIILCTFEFILLFVIFLDLLSYCRALSDYLQKENVDFRSSHSKVCFYYALSFE